MTDELLSLNRAARHCGVTAKWLKIEAAAGRVPCLPAGTGQYLFDPETLVSKLRERARQTLPKDVALC